MNISVTFNGETINIVNIQVNGTEIYITYVDSTGALKVTRAFFSRKDDNAVATLGTDSIII